MRPEEPLRPTPLEIASGIIVGEHEAVEIPSTDLHPASALEEAVLPALARPPCLVSFSGGRDSSVVLAVATTAARRHGLPEPIPITLRFAEAPGSEESAWQELVVGDLELSDWPRLEIGDELDLIGPIAGPILRRHGVLFPANAFLHAQLLEQARGGSLLTGYGGDHVFLGWDRRRLADVAAGRARATPRDLLRLGLALGPASLRRHRERRRARERVPRWLRPGAREEIASAWAAEDASQPISWRAFVAWMACRRRIAAGRWSLSVLAADADARIEHPFLAPAFLGALAALGGRRGFGDRTLTMRALFADALPDAILARSSKAHFDEAFVGRRTRAFVDGGTLEGRWAPLVDAEEVRRVFQGSACDFRAGLLVQAAWLAAGREVPSEVTREARSAARGPTPA